MKRQVACLLLLSHMLVSCGPNIEINKNALNTDLDRKGKGKGMTVYEESSTSTDFTLIPIPTESTLIATRELALVAEADIASTSQQQPNSYTSPRFVQPTIDKLTQSNKQFIKRTKESDPGSYYMRSDKSWDLKKSGIVYTSQRELYFQRNGAKSLKTANTYVVTAHDGHQVTLVKQGSNWLGYIDDKFFQGFSRRLTLPVRLEKGLSIEALAEHGEIWQRNHIHIFLPEKVGQDSACIYIGSLGLWGGGNGPSAMLMRYGYHETMLNTGVFVCMSCSEHFLANGRNGYLVLYGIHGGSLCPRCLDERRGAERRREEQCRREEERRQEERRRAEEVKRKAEEAKQKAEEEERRKEQLEQGLQQLSRQKESLLKSNKKVEKMRRNNLSPLGLVQILIKSWQSSQQLEEALATKQEINQEIFHRIQQLEQRVGIASSSEQHVKNENIEQWIIQRKQGQVFLEKVQKVTRQREQELQGLKEKLHALQDQVERNQRGLLNQKDNITSELQDIERTQRDIEGLVVNVAKIKENLQLDLVQNQELLEIQQEEGKKVQAQLKEYTKQAEGQQAKLVEKESALHAMYEEDLIGDMGEEIKEDIGQSTISNTTNNLHAEENTHGKVQKD